MRADKCYDFFYRGHMESSSSSQVEARRGQIPLSHSPEVITEPEKTDFRGLVSVLPLSCLKNPVGFVLPEAQSTVAQVGQTSTG